MKKGNISRFIGIFVLLAGILMAIYLVVEFLSPTKAIAETDACQAAGGKCVGRDVKCFDSLIAYCEEEGLICCKDGLFDVNALPEDMEMMFDKTKESSSDPEKVYHIWFRKEAQRNIPYIIIYDNGEWFIKKGKIDDNKFKGFESKPQKITSKTSCSSNLCREDLQRIIKNQEKNKFMNGKIPTDAETVYLQFDYNNNFGFNTEQKIIIVYTDKLGWVYSCGKDWENLKRSFTGTWSSNCGKHSKEFLESIGMTINDNLDTGIGKIFRSSYYAKKYVD
jgi:hypothetical protein